MSRIAAISMRPIIAAAAGRMVPELLGWWTFYGLCGRWLGGKRAPTSRKRDTVSAAHYPLMAHIVVSPTTIRRSIPGLAALLLIAGTAILMRAQTVAPPATGVPGALTDGSTLLSNGWRLTPAGRQVVVGSLPLNLAISPDGRYAVVTNNGVNRPSFSVIDIASSTVKSTTVIDAAWLGLVFSPDGTRLYSSGAAQNNVQEYTFADGV